MIAPATATDLTHAADDAAAGWQAELNLRFERRRGRTVIASRRQRGPLLVQRAFYPEGDEVCHAYLLHPPAGIVGGDRLTTTIDVAAEAHALLTTPAATRWYFSHGREARALQHATVASGATLEWLPQETLLLDGTHARLRTRIDLEGHARFCGWEIFGFGRPACGERFDQGNIDCRFEIYRDDHPLLLDRLCGGVGGVPGLRSAAAAATLMASPADASALESVRQVLEQSPTAVAAATLIGNLLVVRAIAAECEPLRDCFASAWRALRPILLGRAAAPPRIWRT